MIMDLVLLVHETSDELVCIGDLAVVARSSRENGLQVPCVLVHVGVRECGGHVFDCALLKLQAPMAQGAFRSPSGSISTRFCSARVCSNSTHFLCCEVYCRTTSWEVIATEPLLQFGVL